MPKAAAGKRGVGKVEKPRRGKKGKCLYPTRIMLSSGEY